MNHKEPSLQLSLGLILICIFILSFGILKLDVAPHILLLICSTITTLIAFKLGYSWSEIEDSIIEGIKKIYL